MPPALTVIGADIGNTRLTVGLVDEHGCLWQQWQEPNPRAAGAEASLRVVVAMLREALQAAPTAEAVGIGFGGPVDLATGEIRRSHHTSGWEGICLATVVSKAVGLPAFLDNDANAAGLGEAWFGAGRGADSLLYINVGTGIGGALILNGRVHHGAHSNAGEIGHVVLTPGTGPVCTCGKHGCLEAWASGEALGAAARRALEEEAEQETLLRGLRPAEITGRQVSQAAREGDRLAQDILRQGGHYLGLALAGACNLLDPQIVVIGGGVSQDNPVYLEAAREAFAAYATPPVAAHTPLVAAQLGYEAGVIGAATVALQALGAVQ